MVYLPSALVSTPYLSHPPLLNRRSEMCARSIGIPLMAFPTTPAKRHTMSPAGRQRIAAAQRARWAKKKVAESLTTPVTTTPVKRKASWTPAMGKAAADRMRKTNAKLQAARKKAAKARQST
jgi:hypothetical protein